MVTSDQQPLERLGLWLVAPHGPVWKDIARMTHRMHVYRRFMAICEKAPPEVTESGGEFQQWAMTNYGEAQLSAIRRQATAGSNVQTLRRLIIELAACTDDEQARAGMRHDLRAMRKATRRAIAHTSTFIAHRIERGSWDKTAQSSETITFAEIHECVDLLGQTFSKYERLLLDVTTAWDNLTMTRWDEAFRHAWIAGGGED